jgi:hypothetical protein
VNNISNHITYSEATLSTTAIRKSIKNEPNAEQLGNMGLVAEKVFEPVRIWYKKPIKINSFFRNEKLNVAVGGSTTSDHCKGMAIDVSCEDNAKIFDYIKKNLNFTQLIWEYGNDIQPDWVHFSYDKNNLKKQVLRAKRVGKKTVYV